MKTNWIICKKKYDDITSQLLHNREVDLDVSDAFLHPDFENDFFDSKLLPDYKKFQDRITLAINSKETTGIFADYDADGIPGAALLYKALNKLGLKCEIYIPTREEGYGLSQKGIDELIKNKCSLIITVDLGIKSFAEAKYCISKEVDLIITDHHLPDDELPNAVAVINPKIKGSKYPFDDLCGAGVIYKLIYGLSKVFSDNIDEKFLKWNLDLAAISTISDVVSVVSENRLIAKYGLIVLNKTQNCGLRKLIEVSELSNKKIGVYEVGFMIGPRLNAPGRICNAVKSFRLLTTDDEAEAMELAEELNSENILRQKQMESLLKEADQIIANKKLSQNNIIVVCGKWPKGIIGPSASKIAEKYYRPAIVFSKNETEFVGSARSVKGVNIFDILSKASKYIIKFGGHKSAAGLAVAKANYKKFYEEIIQICKRDISDSDLIKKYNVDLETNFDKLSFELVQELEKMEPFGMGNSRPIFLSRGVTISQPKFVGRSNNHLSSTLLHHNKRIKSIYFSCPLDPKMIAQDTKADILYNVAIDSWNEQRYLNINIIDMDLDEKV